MTAPSIRRIIILTGPNGAGKSTFAREILPREANCPVFVNADLIAAGLSPFDPQKAALRAGRVMLEEINRHLRNRESFAFETTLAGKRYARLIPLWQAQGYSVQIIFLRLPSVQAAIDRVAARVAQGGHDIAAAVVERRFHKGLRNFELLYSPLVDSWRLFDNAGPTPVLISRGSSR